MSEFNLEDFLIRYASKKAFRPVQATETNLKQVPPVDGCVYFTTDSKKIYLGTSDKYLSMGGNSGIYYGRKSIAPDNSGNTPNPQVFFIYPDDIEGENIPLINDLILNTDGCFYRVKNVESNTIETTRLTLQGTGVGGGSGGGGNTGASNLRITHSGGQNRYFSAEAVQADLGVVAYSDDSSDYISMVELSWDDKFTSIFSTIENLTHPMEKPLSVSILKFLSNISTKGTRIYLRLTNKYGLTREIYYNITIASLQLAELEDSLISVTSNSMDYKCKVGGSLELDSRIVKYDLYNNSSNKPIYSTELELTATQSGQITKSIDLSTVNHGEYTLKVQIIGEINGSNNIYSNILTHKILKYDDNIGLPIFAVLIPEKIEQYTPFTISYMLSYGNVSNSYSAQILVEDEEIATEEINANVINDYKLTFSTKGNRYLSIIIDELGINYRILLDVTDYTGNLPIIDVNRDDLKINLTAEGRTNKALDKEIWTNSRNTSIKATLNDFYYRAVNGWMTDENGVDYLKVSQGAYVELNDYTPFATNPQTNGLTVELDFMIDGILDYDANLIECVSRDSIGITTGFVVKGDVFKYYVNSKELVSLNLVENKRIKLSFVIEPSALQTYPMCYTYLDGIISNVVNYDKGYDFTNTANSPAHLKINSAGGQINIYNIRFYSTGLDAQTILNNYQASIGSLEERQKNYDSNAIRAISGDIDLASIEANKYNLQIPYVKIYGGFQSNKEFKMSDAASNNNPALPIGKKDFRAIDLKIVYPTEKQNPYFKNYSNFEVNTTFEDESLNVVTGFGKTPNEGAIMYAQGTSSLEYPVKNLRVKLKGKKFTVRPDIAPVKLITFKADFMESSGSHNTGAANYIDAVYSYANMETPGQEHFADKNKGTIVTCIKGHPCVIFWNPGVDEKGNILDKDDPANYTYIGKYNFNLDKATPEPFGFMNDDTDETFGYEVDETGALVLDDEGKKKNSIYCFEFLDNNAAVCNFRSDDESRGGTPEKAPSPDAATEIQNYYKSWYETRINEDKEEVPGWRIGFESRYPEDKEDYPDADALWPFASWLNELYAIRYIDGRAEEAIAKFKKEYKQYLNVDFLLAYYVLTEALLMADSRVKNMMIATWGKELRYRLADGTVVIDKPSKGTAVEGVPTGDDYNQLFGYIWYPIFYDMDTMLGLDNIGYVKKYYYDEDTDENVFNGDEYLWKFVRDALPTEIAQFYNKLESANAILTKNAIVPYFNENQATMANETFYNEDAFYKYIDTFRNGYTNHLTGEEVEKGQGTRLYAAQGNRAMPREYFIENRLRYLRGKYSSTNYQSGDRIEFRLTYPKKIEGTELTEEQRRINASIEAVPPVGKFNYTSLKTGYAGVKIGKNSTPVNKKFVGKQTQEIEVDTSSGNGTETYLLGVSNLSDVGDLSNKYLYKLVVGAAQNNLKKLILGNHHKDYYNPYWGDESSIELTGFRFLEEFNLENCDTFTGTINFTESSQIKKIFLNGSQTSVVTLPVGGVIEELRIPNTVSNIVIDSHPTLNDNKFTLGHYDYDTNTYVNDYSRLKKIYINNTNIDTYNIVKNLLNNVDFNNYGFININWIITDQNDCEYDSNGTIVGIKALDYLLTKNVHENIKSGNHADALTGTLTIDINGVSANEYDIYQKYRGQYPNLNIQYGDNVTLERAYRVNFFSQEEISESTKPYYSVLGTPQMSLAYLISADGPNKSQLTAPTKLATSETNYIFSNFWKDADSGILFNQNNFAQEYANKDINFVATFLDTPRKYNVKFYSWDENVLVNENLYWNMNIEEGLSRDYQYIRTTDNVKEDNKEYYIWDTAAIDFIKYEDIDFEHKAVYEKVTKNINPIPFFISRNDSSLNEDQRWGLKGWVNEKDKNSFNPTFYDFTSQIIQGDFTAYAFMEIENVLTTPSNLNLFNFMVDEKTKTSSISLKPQYIDIIEGKLTLPLKDKNGNFITSIAKQGFRGISKITHIYFENNPSYTSQYAIIDEEAFSMHINSVSKASALKSVTLPEGINIIGSKAFKDQIELEFINLPDSITEIRSEAFTASINAPRHMKVHISALPDNLTVLSANAFNKAGDNCTIDHIPSGVKKLETGTFQYCKNVAIAEFGTNDGNGLSSIGMNCFYVSGSSPSEIHLTAVSFFDSVNSISASAFNNGSFLTNAEVIYIYNATLWNQIQESGGMGINNCIPLDKIHYVGG